MPVKITMMCYTNNGQESQPQVVNSIENWCGADTALAALLSASSEP